MKPTQTPLMSWIKSDHTEWYNIFYSYLSKTFTWWNQKQQNGEHIWFCTTNESCQAGFILEYVNKGLKPQFNRVDRNILISTCQIVYRCVDMLMLDNKNTPQSYLSTYEDIIWVQNGYERLAFDIHEMFITKTWNSGVWRKEMDDIYYKEYNNYGSRDMEHLMNALNNTGKYITSLGDTIQYYYGHHYQSRRYDRVLEINGENISNWK